MVDPVSAACIAAIVQVGSAISVQTITAGIVGNRADGLFCRLVRATTEQFSRNARLPENHDVLKALVSVLSQSNRFVAETISQQSSNVQERIIADKVAQWVKQEIAIESEALMSVSPLVLPLIANEEDGDFGKRENTALNVAVDSLIEWIENGIGEPISGRFRNFFFEDAPNGRPCWLTVFQLLLREAIKTNDRFERIFVASNVADIVGHVVNIKTLVTGLSAGLAGVEAHLSGLTGQVVELRQTQIEQNAVLAAQNSMMTEMLELLRSKGALQKAQDEGFSEETIRGIIRRAGGEGIPSGSMLMWLEAWIDEARIALTHSANQNAAFETALLEARNRFRRGDLAVASEPLMDLLAKEEAESRQKKERYIRAAVEIDILAFAFNEAIAKLDLLAAPSELDLSNPVSLIFFYHTQGNYYYSSGSTTASNGKLLLAIRLYEKAVSAGRTEQLSSEQASALVALGNAQMILGTRESDNDRLYAAVESFNQALLSLGKGIEASQSAAMQCSLGQTWSSLAFRQGTDDTYKKAEEAFHRSLEIYNPEQNPKEWNIACSGLASLKATRGLRLHDAKLLSEAIASYRNLLEFSDDSSVDIHSAIGSAYRNLGTVSNDRSCFENARHHAQIAVDQIDSAAQPLRWAHACAVLGSAYNGLHNHPEEKPYLQLALEAYEQALKVFSRSDHPVEWARCMHNVADSKSTMAKCYGQITLFPEAIQTFDLSIEERRREIVPLEWARTMYARASSIVEWDISEDTLHRHEAALADYCSAMMEIRPDNLPGEWQKIWQKAQNVMFRMLSSGRLFDYAPLVTLLKYLLEHLDKDEHSKINDYIQLQLADNWASQLFTMNCEDDPEAHASKSAMLEELAELDRQITFNSQATPGSFDWAQVQTVSGKIQMVSGVHYEDAGKLRLAATTLSNVLAVFDSTLPALGIQDVWLAAAVHLVFAKCALIEAAPLEISADDVRSFLDFVAEKRPSLASTFLETVRHMLDNEADDPNLMPV